MTRSYGIAMAVFAAGCFFLGSVAVAQSSKKKLLFDGKTWSGFEADQKYWSIEDGAFVGTIPSGTTLNKNTWLVWKGGEVRDFDLSVEFKLTGAPGANSGIQFRCQVDSVDHVSGYQADLDMGPTWLGRIYDEHGRALLVERGTRVLLDSMGKKRVETFAPASMYGVLFRENAWNDYRIVAVGDRVDVYINGTLFSQLKDEELRERDLSGSLAFQLHSGGETKIQFRNIQLENLNENDRSRLSDFELKNAKSDEESGSENSGSFPLLTSGGELNGGFETGDLKDWVLEGAAFEEQPVNRDGIHQRWPDQQSNKQGDYFIGSFEKRGDVAKGTLTSSPILVTQPYLSFLIGGGKNRMTRVEVLLDESGKESVIAEVSGDDREQMRRVALDLGAWKGKSIRIRLVDESSDGWGHLNFDDVRIHEKKPSYLRSTSHWRTTENPVLQHLVPNPNALGTTPLVEETLKSMRVPKGFSVQSIAAEPDLHQPMAFTFDSKGRLWVVEGYSYPQKRASGEGLDRILIFIDTNHDGSFETKTVFAEGLNLVSGLQVGYGGVWVGAAPELLFIPDADGDDRPDGPPQVLLDGFGFADTHETINSFLWGPDGWLYGNQGVFNYSEIGKPGTSVEQRLKLNAGVWRYHPTRHVFEVFAHGGSNQWGLDYDSHGQLFMTHCRSFWGQGLTTHVVQGGQYWNQVNSGYAPYISVQPLPGYGNQKSYLLASARYGHGEGGAGKPGSGEVYGGHSHVGTMIYLGDNWPNEYRNHLFTHNLHGHQMNHQINLREAGGYNTVHAGSDLFFCGDPQFVGVALQVGPDGAVYMSDWYDPRHCHNPNTELWDRGNGRIYRMQYDANFKAANVDYSKASVEELIAAQKSKNDWKARIARTEIAFRNHLGKVESKWRNELIKRIGTERETTVRLNLLWTLHAIDGDNESFLIGLLTDPDEYVRSWAIQLGCESERAEGWGTALVAVAKNDDSMMVKRYLASAMQRVSTKFALAIGLQLASQKELESDRDLPVLLWQSLAPLVQSDWAAGLVQAEKMSLHRIRDLIYWYAAKSSDEGRAHLIQLAKNERGESQKHFVLLLEKSISDLRGISMPDGWLAISSALYDSADAELRNAAQSIGAVLNDKELFSRLRKKLSQPGLSDGDRIRTLQWIALDPSKENLEIYLQLLDSSISPQIIPLLRKYDDVRVALVLIDKIGNWPTSSVSASMDLLSGRVDWALLLLDAIKENRVKKEVLTAYFARQMSLLGDDNLKERIRLEWGNVGQSSAQLKEEIKKTIQSYSAAPLWAFNGADGQATFKKLCANCHLANSSGTEIAPKLEGTSAKGIDYLVENVIDPNAVIGRDYQALIVMTDDGQVITGLKTSESDTSITLKTANDSITISKSEIDQIKVSENSFMPTGLLNSLNDRERIELFKYIMSL